MKTKSLYSVKAIFTQSPEKLKNTLVVVLGLFGAWRGWNPDLISTVAVGGAFEKVLDLFYVTPVRKAQENKVALTAFENVKLNAQKRPLRAEQPVE